MSTDRGMSETPTDQQLAEWEALEAAATPGRWEAITDDHGRDGLNFSVWAGDADGKYGKYITERVMTSAADTEFIAAARNAFPVLMRALREARDDFARLRASAGAMHEAHTLTAKDKVRANAEAWRLLAKVREVEAERNALRDVLDRVADALAADEQAVLKVAAAQQLLIDAGLAAPTGQEDQPSGLGERLEAARSKGREHERDYPGHTTTEIDQSDYAQTAVRIVCDACWQTWAAGGPRDPAPWPPVHLIEEGKQ